MDTKRPFASTAARASAGFAVGALALSVVVWYLERTGLTGVPEVYGRALVTLSALGVCACLLVSSAMGVMALCGVRTHGRPGILAPAMIGLTLSGFMLLPILLKFGADMAAQAREVPPPAVSTNRTQSP